jgi:uncharacterized protein
MKSGYKYIYTSIIILFLLTPSFNKAQNNEDVVIGKYLRLHSEVMNEERTMLISLPDSYTKTNEKYPVLYVLDGGVQAMIEAKAAVQMSKYSFCPDMIIVAIENTERNRDMLPGTDAAPKFLRFITKELFSYMKKEYRVDDNQRILYGGSNAGLFTVFSFLDNPDNFSAYIASSPTICHRKGLMVDKLKKMIDNNVRVNKYLYIIYGDIDFPQVTDTLAVYIPLLKELEPNGLRMHTEYLPEDGHIPYGSLEYGLMAAYEGYSYPGDKLENEGLDSMKAYYDRYSKKVGYVQKIPKQRILFFGQELLRKNKTQEAVEAFKYGCSLYHDDYESTLLLAIAEFKNNCLADAKRDYLHTKEIMNKIKETNDPPLEEWKEMKKKFDS